MSLPVALRTKSATIAERWLAAQPDPDESSRAFTNRLPTLIEAIAVWLEGDRESATLQLHVFAAGHALDRHVLGSDLSIVLGEYAALRNLTVEVALESIHSELATHLVSLGAALDSVTGHAVKCFELERDRLRERFIGMLVHDLRDPLTAVMMSANLLADMTLGDRQAQLVGRISRGARRIERMVDDVIDFARSRLGEGLTIATSSFDLIEVCHEVIGEHRAQPAPRDIVFEPSGSLAGSWDRDRARQAVANLISNATQGSHGQIHLRAGEREDRSSVFTSVTNRGPVIAPDGLARMFDPLAHALIDPTRVRGIGLGLYLVERIALAHGGSVRATSTLADGTTITIEWPRPKIEEP